MNKISLDALLFSMSEYESVREWAETNAELFDVRMPSGVAFASLGSVVYEPEIHNTNAAGILIADHNKYSENILNAVASILAARGKQLYAVSNGVRPVVYLVGINQPLEMHEVHYFNTPILKQLFDCRSALCFLNENGPTQVVPKQFEEQVRCLEKLGFVFRRNSKTFSLRHQRLKRVLERESKTLCTDYHLEDLLNAKDCAGSGILVRSIA